MHTVLTGTLQPFPASELVYRLQSFTPFSVNDFVDAVGFLPDKFSAADPIPTYALISDQIAPSRRCLTALWRLADFRFPSKLCQSHPF